MQTLAEILQTTEHRLRVFAGLQILFFGVVALVLKNSWVTHGVLILILSCSVAIGCIGMISPKWIRPVYVIWMLAVFPIGWLLSHVLLAVVFYIVVTPIGLWRVRSNGDPLQREWNSEATTYWEKRKPDPPPETYFRQF